ncbi:glycosyltransferase family 2 protein [Dysgonomonas sp. 511]|uniref:glycosyltransferase family 2 protein n=1 Tax=Dysgonomonas sp. 511 TaxID=2302930 RepID=UPI0013D1D20C|nr:glycosyltransferase family 2 protein [Dysgonomonas sp. 511]NDV78808.1 glycosyltransferase [Dysgonomonas sp. 511]
MKRLSIITINYNNAPGLKKTIRSIVPQLSDDIEYIVIDGGSKDNSVDYIKEQNGKIAYWISEPDTGIYHAMNKGIEKAGGEYLLFVNSGDTINAATDLSGLIKDISGEDIIYYNLQIADSNGQTYIKTYPPYLDFKFFAESSLPHCATFISKQLLVEYGYYDQGMRVVADWAFFIDAVCLLRCSYKYIDKYFSTFYLDGISSQPENFAALWHEKEGHIKEKYPLYYSIYKEWMEKKDELYRLKSSVSVRFLKKVGFLKWLKL